MHISQTEWVPFLEVGRHIYTLSVEEFTLTRLLNYNMFRTNGF